MAAELPLETIMELLGIPEGDRRKLFQWTNEMTASDDPDFTGDPQVASYEVLAYSMQLAAERMDNPRDDIVTKLLAADKEGRGLTELGSREGGQQVERIQPLFPKIDSPA